MGWVVKAKGRPLYRRQRDPVSIVQEAGWAPEPVWKGVENLDPTGILSPDGSVCSESLYRRGYPVHKLSEYKHYVSALKLARCESKI